VKDGRAERADARRPVVGITGGHLAEVIDDVPVGSELDQGGQEGLASYLAAEHLVRA
jgi:hypothetical protein